MNDIIIVLGSEVYKVLDVVDRPADRSLYGAGTYVYIENVHLEQFPSELQWRAKAEIVMRPDASAPEYRFISWNLGITLGTTYTSRIRDAAAAFRSRKTQEVQNATV